MGKKIFSDRVGDTLGSYAKAIFKVSSWLFGILWGFMAPIILSFPGLIVVAIVIALLIYDFTMKSIIKVQWVLGTTISEIGWVGKIIGGIIKGIALLMKKDLDLKTYMAKAAIKGAMAGVEFTTAGVTSLASMAMQGGMSVLSSKSEVITQEKELGIAQEEKTKGALEEGKSETKEEEKLVNITYTQEDIFDINRRETLKSYDITAEMLQYSLRFGKYWNKALATGMIRREQLENYYKRVNGESEIPIMERSSEEKTGSIKDVYYYTYNRQIEVIKNKEQDLENLNYNNIESIDDKISDLESSIKSETTKLETCSKEINTLKSDITKLREEIKEYDSKLKNGEEYTDEYKNLVLCKSFEGENVMKDGLQVYRGNLKSGSLSLDDYMSVDKYNNSIAKIMNEEGIDSNSEEIDSTERKKVSNSKEEDDTSYLESISIIDEVNELVNDKLSFSVMTELYEFLNKYLGNIDILSDNANKIIKMESKKISISKVEEAAFENYYNTQNEVYSYEENGTNYAYTVEPNSSQYRSWGKKKDLSLIVEALKTEKSDVEAKINGLKTYIKEIQAKEEEIGTKNKELKAKEKTLKEIQTSLKSLESSKVELINLKVASDSQEEERKRIYSELQQEKEKLYELFMGPELYYALVEDGDKSNECKLDYIMELYYPNDTAYENLKDGIKELLDNSADSNWTTLDKFVGTENGFDEMSINDALNKMVQPRYGGYGYPKSFYTTQNNGDYVLGAQVLTYEHTAVIAPENLKLLEIGMKDDPTGNGKKIVCISFISTDYAREYRVMGLEDISKFFNAKLKKDYKDAAEVVIKENGTLNIAETNYEVNNVIIPEGTVIGTFGKNIVTLLERRAAAEREQAKLEQNAKVADVNKYTTEQNLAIINSPNTYASVFIELNESSRSSVLDIEPDFIIPIDKKGMYRYATTDKENKSSLGARIYGGAIKAEKGMAITDIGIDREKGEYIKFADGTEYSKAANNIVEFGDRAKELLYSVDPYWSSKTYEFDYDNNDYETKTSDNKSTTKKSKKEDIVIGDIIGVSIQEEVVEDNSISRDEVKKYGEDTEIRVKTTAKGFTTTHVNRKTVEIKCEEAGQIVQVGKDKNGMLKVKIKGNTSGEIKEYINLYKIGEKVKSKLDSTFTNKKNGKNYRYVDWDISSYVMYDNYPEDKKTGEFASADMYTLCDKAKSKIPAGEGICFKGRTVEVKDSPKGTVAFNESDSLLEVVAPENCILTKAGWSTDTGWTVQLTSLDYERRYTFSKLSSFSLWIQGVIGNKIGPDWQTKKYDDITIDEYRIIEKGEIIGRMGASEGPDIGEIPLIAPETLRIVKMGYKVANNSEDAYSSYANVKEAVEDKKYYCVRLESLDGKRAYEIEDMDISGLTAHTVINGYDDAIVFLDEEYKDIVYANCSLAKNKLGTKENKAIVKNIENVNIDIITKVGKDTSTISTTLPQYRLNTLYLYEGEIIGYAKMKKTTDSVQKLAGVQSKELQTRIKVGASKSVVTTSDTDKSKEQNLVLSMSPKVSDLFDAVHVDVLIEKFGTLMPSNFSEKISEKGITITKIEAKKEENKFLMSYTESDHRVIKVQCYNNNGEVIATTQFKYARDFDKGGSYNVIKELWYSGSGDKVKEDKTGYTRNKDKNNKYTVEDIALYVPDGNINEVSKIRIFDSAGNSTDYDINEIKSVEKVDEGIKLNILLASDNGMGISRIDCYNKDGNNILEEIGANIRVDDEDTSIYYINKKVSSDIDQVKVTGNTGYVMYLKPQMLAVNKENQNSIELKFAKGREDIKKIDCVDEDGNIYTMNQENIKSMQKEQDGINTLIIGRAKGSNLSGNAYKVNHIMIYDTKGQYTTYKCMTIDDVQMGKNDKIAEIVIKFTEGEGDLLSLVQVYERNASKPFLESRANNVSEKVTINVGAERLGKIEKVLLKSSNGDVTEYYIRNKIYKAEITGTDTVRVQFSAYGSEKKLPNIELLDAKLNKIGEASIKDITEFELSIKLYKGHTTDEVRVVKMGSNSTVEDLYTMLSIEQSPSGKEFLIFNKEGVGLNKIEYYKVYGEKKTITHTEVVEKNKKLACMYYTTDDEGKIKIESTQEEAYFIKDSSLNDEDTGIILWDDAGIARDVQIKPAITGCRVTNKNKLQVDFSKGLNELKTLTVEGSGKVEKTFKIANGKAKTQYINFTTGTTNIKKLTVSDMKNVGSYTELKFEKVDHEKYPLKKVVLVDSLGFKAEYDFLEVNNIVNKENYIVMSVSGATSVQYYTVNDGPFEAEKRSDGYYIPKDEATKIIIIDGTYTSKKEIYGPSIISAVKKSLLDNEVAITIRSEKGKANSSELAYIQCFNEEENIILEERIIVNAKNQNETTIKLADWQNKDISKIRVVDEMGLIAEMPASEIIDKTEDAVKFEWISVNFSEGVGGINLIAKVETEMWEIVKATFWKDDNQNECESSIKHEDDSNVWTIIANVNNYDVNKIKLVARYNDSIVRDKEYKLFTIEEVKKNGSDIEIKIQGEDTVGAANVYGINGDQIVQASSKGNGNYVIRDGVGTIKAIEARSAKGLIELVEGPKIKSANKVDAKDGKVNLEMEVQVNGKPLDGRINVWDDKGNKFDVECKEKDLVTTVELDKKLQDMSNIKVIADTGLCDEIRVLDKTEASNKTTIESVTIDDTSYTIRIKTTDAQRYIKEAIAEYRNGYDRLSEDEIKRLSVEDCKEVKIPRTYGDNLPISLSVRDDRGEWTKEYKLMHVEKVEGLDTGGVRVTFDRNLCGIIEVYWLNENGQSRLENNIQEKYTKVYEINEFVWGNVFIYGSNGDRITISKTTEGFEIID